MMKYWPNAVVVRKTDTERENAPFRLHTTDAAIDYHHALIQIDEWAKGYDIITAWIEKENESRNVIDRYSIVGFECNVDVFGQRRPHKLLIKDEDEQ